MINANIIGCQVEVWERCAKGAEGAEALPPRGGTYAPPWTPYHRKVRGEIVGVNEENWTVLVLFTDGALRVMMTRSVTIAPPSSSDAPMRATPVKMPVPGGGAP